MRIGLFTDAHYSSQKVTCGVRNNADSLRKVREAYRFFEEEKCELVICLGDLTDADENHEAEVMRLTEVAEVINASPIETVVVMGNHDGFTFTEDEFYGILGEEHRPATRIYGEKKLVFLDACFCLSGRHYLPGDTDWTDTYLPDVEGLAREIEGWQGEAYLFIHQAIDPEIPESTRIKNDREVRELIEKSGCVRRVYQGHHHPGGQNVVSGVEYITLPAMCEGEGVRFAEEI